MFKHDVYVRVKLLIAIVNAQSDGAAILAHSLLGLVDLF